MAISPRLLIRTRLSGATSSALVLSVHWDLLRSNLSRRKSGAPRRMAAVDTPQCRLGQAELFGDALKEGDGVVTVAAAE